MRQRDLFLMDTGEEWKSVGKLQDCQLINNAVFMMKIYCKFPEFPRKVPADSQLLSKEDRSILSKGLASKMDGIDFFINLGSLSNT
jgi:hypothetical protein